jgi:hypothetical protein
MQIGDKVLFTHYAGKEHLGFMKSKTTRVPTPEPIEGIVIGKSRVYDSIGSDDNYTPILSDPREVILIATSWWKRYKVFEGDIMTQPNTPQPVGLPQGAGTPQNPQPVGLPNQPQGQLEQLITDAVNAKVAAGEEFTAWDITQELRAANPSVVIPHQAVRTIVHNLMLNELLTGTYTGELKDFNGNQAIVYTPA